MAVLFHTLAFIALKKKTLLAFFFLLSCVFVLYDLVRLYMPVLHMTFRFFLEELSSPCWIH